MFNSFLLPFVFQDGDSGAAQDGSREAMWLSFFIGFKEVKITSKQHALSLTTAMLMCDIDISTNFQIAASLLPTHKALLEIPQYYQRFKLKT